ncbi:membrane protein insertion efficiency factor YidD [Intestinibacter sp.]
MSKKNIPHYINNPAINTKYAPEKELYRPEIRWKYSLAKLLFLVIVTCIISAIIERVVVLIGVVESNKQWEIFLISTILISTSLIRFLLIFFIRIYQNRAKSETRLRCCYVPSCSEYAILSIRRYGTIIGGGKTIRRLLRCHPPGGIDFPYSIKKEQQLEAHLRKRVIKRICEERLPDDESTFPIIVLTGFIENKENIDYGKFQISIMWGNCKELKWKRIVVDKYFKVIECELEILFWSDCICTYIHNNELILIVPGNKFSFPFSVLDEIDVNALIKVMTKIIKCSNMWASPFTDYHLHYDEQAAYEYINKLLKQLKRQMKNGYFYN